MKYRHEWKFEISSRERLILRTRLSRVMKHDRHARKGTYRIRSLYFDTLTDKALREKIDGVNTREKFRIRYYNDDLSYIQLEKKSKINGLCAKRSTPISVEIVQAILAGDYAILCESNDPLIIEFYTKLVAGGLRPKTIVEYTREPFVFAPGNVRITLDYNIRSGLFNTDFLNPESVTVSAGDPHIILEVKWDEFLPDIVRDALQVETPQSGAFSKYAACRIYG